MKKPRTLRAHGVPHYWLIDPEAETLSVFRYEQAGYLVVLTSTIGETVRAEPFTAIDIAVGELFGHEE